MTTDILAHFEDEGVRKAGGRPLQPLPVEDGLYYRAHHKDAPFGREHASTQNIGEPPSPEMAKYWEPKPGYSAFWHPHHLRQYLDEMGWSDADDMKGRRVLMFRGAPVGEGADGEPRVVPHADKPEASMSPGQFRRRLEITPEPGTRWDDHTWGQGPSGQVADDGYRTILGAARPGRGQETCGCCQGNGEHPDGTECDRCDGFGLMHRGDDAPYCPGQPQPRRRHWREGAVIPEPKWDPERYENEGRSYSSEMLDKGHEWKRQVRRSLSLGTMTNDEARESGYHGQGHDQGDDGSARLSWEPLPQRLYHVTTDLAGVREHGLKSRDELGQQRGGGHGLGGGEDDTISFTGDPGTARGILSSLHEFHRALTGRLSPQAMWDMARSGTGAARPYHEGIAENYRSGWKDGDPLPLRLRHVLNGREGERELATREDMERRKGPGWEPEGEPLIGDHMFSEWSRPASEDSRRESAASLYKAFAFHRMHAGGREDPLFFATDTKSLARKDPRNFAIVHASPRPGARGYRVHSLGEWRTAAGDAVSVHHYERLRDKGQQREAVRVSDAPPPDHAEYCGPGARTVWLHEDDRDPRCSECGHRVADPATGKPPARTRERPPRQWGAEVVNRQRAKRAQGARGHWSPMDWAAENPHRAVTRIAQDSLAEQYPDLARTMQLPDEHDIYQESMEGNRLLRRMLGRNGYPQREAARAFVMPHDHPEAGVSQPVLDEDGQPGVALLRSRFTPLILAHEAGHLLHVHHAGIDAGPYSHRHGEEAGSRMPDEAMHGPEFSRHFAGALDAISPGAGSDLLRHRADAAALVSNYRRRFHSLPPVEASMPEPDYDPSEPLPQGRGLFWRLHDPDDRPLTEPHARSRRVDWDWLKPGETDPDTGLKNVHIQTGLRGFSAFQSPHQLHRYMEEYGWSEAGPDGEHAWPDSSQVVAFHGKQVGRGDDGEPLVIPHPNEKCCGRIIHSGMDWDEFEHHVQRTMGSDTSSSPWNQQHAHENSPEIRSIERHHHPLRRGRFYPRALRGGRFYPHEGALMRHFAAGPEDYGMDHRPDTGGPPLHDLTDSSETDWSLPADYYDRMHEYSQNYDADNRYGIAESERKVRRYRGQPDKRVRVWRAAPAVNPESRNGKRGEINHGDWIGLSRQKAVMEAAKENDPPSGSLPADHPRRYHIWSAMVPAKHVRNADGDLTEWGYAGPDIKDITHFSEYCSHRARAKREGILRHFAGDSPATGHYEEPTGGSLYPVRHVFTAVHPDGTRADLRYVLSKSGRKGAMDSRFHIPAGYGESLGVPLARAARRMHPQARITGMPGVGQDWDSLLPSVTSLHRGLTLRLPQPDHSFLHDDSVPKSRRAARLMELMAGHPSMHWASRRGLAAAEEDFGNHEFRRPGDTQVMLSADAPRREDVETDPERLLAQDVHEHAAPHWEVPLREGAPVSVTSVRWRQGSGPWSKHLFRGGRPFTAARQREGDEREWNGYTLRYRTEDQGERKPRHVIEAFPADGTVAGRLTWYGATGKIHRIETAGPEDARGESGDGFGNGADHRRKGLATAMWDWSQEMTPRARHSGDQTGMGTEWARSLRRKGARRDPALPNPHTGGDEWFHGSPWKFGQFGENSSTLEFEDDPHDTSHWNALLGHHFAASHKTAEEFAGAEHSADPDGSYDDGEPARNIIHARLHLTNPKIYASEHDMDQEAYEHEWKAGNHHDLHHEPELRDDEWGGEYDPDYDERPPTYQYAGHGDRMRSQEESDPSYWNQSRSYHPYATGWLNTHPDKYSIAQRFRDRLKARGHDGIVYGNEFEGSQIGKGDKHHLAAIAFHPHQVDVTQRHSGPECIEPEAAGRSWPGSQQHPLPGMPRVSVLRHFASGYFDEVNWDEIHPEIAGEPLHRGVGVTLPGHLHRFVHDRALPRQQRAEALLDYLGDSEKHGYGRDSQAGLGTHWSMRRDTAENFAENAAKHEGGGEPHPDYGMIPGEREHAVYTPPPRPASRPGTAVVFHSRVPDRDDIDERAGDDMGVYHPYSHDEAEVPVRSGAGIGLTGVSWAPVHDEDDPRSWDGPQYEHHEFGEPDYRTAARSGSMPHPDYDPSEELPEGRGIFYRAHDMRRPLDEQHARSAPLSHGYRPFQQNPVFSVGQRGYSSFRSPHMLSSYMDEYEWEPAKDREAVAFHGKQVGVGEDNEPLVVPAPDPHCCGRVIHSRMPWEEFERKTWPSHLNDPESEEHGYHDVGALPQPLRQPWAPERWVPGARPWESPGDRSERRHQEKEDRRRERRASALTLTEAMA